MKTLLRRPFDALFCASGAHVLKYAALRFSKNTPTDSPQQVFGLVLFACLLFAWPGAAQARPVVVELFTSEACSSCPPAEALLARLQKTNPDILPLSFHVTYWNGPAWTDKYSLVGATDRQSWYVGLKNTDQVYTPEAVVDGTAQMVGSNEPDVTSAIANANTANPVPVSVTGGPMLTIHIGNGGGAGAKLWLFGFDAAHDTPVGGGENSGVTIHEVNVVRSITPLGAWTGIASTYTMPRLVGDHAAVLLQTDSGQILGAASD
jgi:hypothetical protein